MNQKDRKELARAETLAQEAAEIISDMADSEREKYDNLPEGLQLSEMGCHLEEVADLLDTVSDEIGSACSSLQEALD